MELNNNWFINQNTFYDIDIDLISRTYSVVEDVEESNETSITIFEKIEKVLNLNFKPLNTDDSYKILKLAEHVCQSYRAKIPTILTYFYNGLEEQLNVIKLALGNDLMFQDKVCLDRDATHNILSLLSTEDVVAYSLVNKNAKAYADLILLERAKKAGYEGLNANLAHVYLKELYIEIKNLFEEPNARESGATNTIRKFVKSTILNKNYTPEEILERFKDLKIEHLVMIYRDGYFANQPEYNKIKKFIEVQEKRRLITCAKERFCEKDMKFVQDNIMEIYRIQGSIDIFIKKGIEIDFHQYHHYTGNLLHLAAEQGDYDFCQFLVEKKVDLNKECANGYTPLSWAVMTKDIKILKFLVDNGARINDNRKTPLNLALEMTSSLKKSHGSYKYIDTPEDVQIEIVKFLLDKGAEVNFVDGYGNTALHLAKSAKIAKLLLSYGANINIVNRDGETAEDKAKNCYRPSPNPYPEGTDFCNHEVYNVLREARSPNNTSCNIQ